MSTPILISCRIPTFVRAHCRGPDVTCRNYGSQQETDFDIVLNCDCVYEPLYGDSWKLLVECIDELLKQNPKTIAITSVERRNADQIDEFLKALQESPHVSTVTKAWEDVDY